MCQGHLPFTLHTANAFLILPSAANILRPSRSNPCMLISHLSLLCSPKKSRGSTIPRSLQPWRLLEAEDSTPESENLTSPFLAPPPPKIKIRQVQYPRGTQVERSKRAIVRRLTNYRNPLGFVVEVHEFM